MGWLQELRCAPTGRANAIAGPVIAGTRQTIVIVLSAAQTVRLLRNFPGELTAMLAAVDTESAARPKRKSCGDEVLRHFS
jgi:hypothetical protein